MESYTSIVENKIEEIPFNQLIVASELYRRVSMQITEQTFYKVLERFSKSGKLVHLSKGIYYRPKRSRFGEVPISENEIAEYYTKNNQGILIGYRMYNEKGITTQIGKQVEVLSTALSEEKKHIHNVYVQRITAPLNDETISIIETMEILQAYPGIENLNIRALTKYMTGFVRMYSEKAMETVLVHRRYKKSTIAFMSEFLNYYNINNSLNRYLSPMSDYNIPKVEELYESA